MFLVALNLSHAQSLDIQTLGPGPISFDMTAEERDAQFCRCDASFALPCAGALDQGPIENARIPG